MSAGVAVVCECCANVGVPIVVHDVTALASLTHRLTYETYNLARRKSMFDM